MSKRNISVIPASTTFGTLRQNLSQSDYLTRKKGLYNYCKNKIICGNFIVAPSYEFKNSYNWGKYTNKLNNCPIIPVNKSNLIMGQYTKMDLANVNTLSEIGPMNPDNPFYYVYSIDPNGELFGNSQCGELNYTSYMIFQPTTNFINQNNLQ
jgi:hypothetical protein